MTLLTPVTAPELVPSPYGLFSLGAEVGATGDDRWVSGLAVESRACGVKISVGDVCDVTLRDVIFDPTEDQAKLCGYEVNPVTIEVETPDRSTFGLRAQNYELWIEEALLVGSQKALEHELWTGGLAALGSYDNRHLASGTAVTDVTPTPGTPVKLRYGLALLEGALGDCGLGSPGVIHMRREVASAMSSLKQTDDGKLTTPLGNLVVAGAGYTGSGPDGTQPATGTWIYATGAVFWWLGAPEIYGQGRLDQVVRPDVNSIKYFAGRPAAVAFDGCCIFAVQVDLGLDYA